MFQYYIIEILKNAQGYAHNVFWAFDANRDLARRKAESKAYELLAEAAIDETYLHSVTVLADDGFEVMSKCYRNVAEPVNPESDSANE